MAKRTPRKPTRKGKKSANTRFTGLDTKSGPGTLPAQEDFNPYNELKLLGDPNTVRRKRNLLLALDKCFGVITPGCKMASVSRETYYNWMEQDIVFKKAVDEMVFIKKDFAEYQVLRLASQGHPQAAIEVNKKINRDRGYGDKLEIGGGVFPGSQNKKIWIPDNGRKKAMAPGIQDAVVVSDADGAVQGTHLPTTLREAS